MDVATISGNDNGSKKKKENKKGKKIKSKKMMEYGYKRAVHTPFATIRSTIRSLKYRLIDSPERFHKLSCSLSPKEPWPKCLEPTVPGNLDKSLEASERLHPCVLTHVRVNPVQRACTTFEVESRPRSRTWNETTCLSLGVCRPTSPEIAFHDFLLSAATRGEKERATKIM